MMKHTIFALLSCVVVFRLMAQSDATFLPGLVESFAKATILGNSSDGPPVQSQVPWGPRSYQATGHFQNVSCRCEIGSGNPQMVAGFIVSRGDSVMLIRAVGPTLASLNLARGLAHPRLELIDSTGKSIAVAVPFRSLNEIVKAEVRRATQEVGTFPLLEGGDDRVLLAFLKADAFSVTVSSEDGASGIALLEIYDLSYAVPPVPSLPPVPPAEPPNL